MLKKLLQNQSKKQLKPQKRLLKWLRRLLKKLLNNRCFLNLLRKIAASLADAAFLLEKGLFLQENQWF